MTVCVRVCAASLVSATSLWRVFSVDWGSDAPLKGNGGGGVRLEFSEGKEEPGSAETGIYLLGAAFVCPLTLVVDAAEVGHDDGHRQSDYQHATQRTDGAKHLPYNGLRNHVSVPAGERGGGQRERERERERQLVVR